MSIQLLDFYKPDPRIFEVTKLEDPVLAGSINAERPIDLYTINQERLQEAHHHTVNSGVRIYHQLSEAGIRHNFIFPLNGAIKLGYDFTLTTLRARPNFFAANVLFADRVKVNGVTKFRYYNLAKNEVDEDTVASSQSVWMDEMIDEANQLKQFAESGLAFPPIALTPVGKEHTSKILSEFYQQNNWPELWSISSIIPDVNGVPLWMLTSGQWNSSFLNSKESILERNCRVAVGVMASDIPVKHDENGNPKTALSDKETYVEWLKQHQSRDITGSESVAANIQEGSTIGTRLELIQRAFATWGIIEG